MRRTGRGKTVRVSDLFEKYVERFSAPEGTVIKTFQEVTHDLFGVDIATEQCSYAVSSKTLKLSASGPLKSEILLRKEEVLLHMKGRLGKKSVPEHII